MHHNLLQLIAGYTEIVQLLISRASDPECLRRMLDTMDVEGDTVSDTLKPLFAL